MKLLQILLFLVTAITMQNVYSSDQKQRDLIFSVLRIECNNLILCKQGKFPKLFRQQEAELLQDLDKYHNVLSSDQWISLMGILKSRNNPRTPQVPRLQLQRSKSP